MRRVAVIGAGISGLAAAFLLSRRYEVHLFERASRLGGHTHTVRVDSPEGELALDTGFVVYNERTYPLLTRLFGEMYARTADKQAWDGVMFAAVGSYGRGAVAWESDIDVRLVAARPSGHALVPRPTGALTPRRRTPWPSRSDLPARETAP